MSGKPEHSHYHKVVEGLSHVDVYRILDLFKVVDPCLQHAIKKLLVAGGRGAGKDISRDIQEAIDSLERWQEMQKENVNMMVLADVRRQGVPYAQPPGPDIAV